jgi:hypothetical protein
LVLVEILKKIGAKVKSEVVDFGQTKRAAFGKKQTWKKVLAKVAGAAFIWIVGGPLAGMASFGVAGLNVVIEDP